MNSTIICISRAQSKSPKSLLLSSYPSLTKIAVRYLSLTLTWLSRFCNKNLCLKLRVDILIYFSSKNSRPTIAEKFNTVRKNWLKTLVDWLRVLATTLQYLAIHLLTAAICILLILLSAAKPFALILAKNLASSTTQQRKILLIISIKHLLFPLVFLPVIASLKVESYMASIITQRILI